MIGKDVPDDRRDLSEFFEKTVEKDGKTYRFEMIDHPDDYQPTITSMRSDTDVFFFMFLGCEE